MAHEIEQDQSGLYALCVFGADEPNDDQQVREEFEQFGEVVELHRVKNLLFIRYATLEEAVHCYESMQKQTKYVVRPGKRKANTDNSERRRRHTVELSPNREMNQRNDNDNFRGRRSDGANNNRRSGGDFKDRGIEMNGNSPMPKLIPASLAPPPADKNKPPQTTARTVVIGNLPPLMKQCHIYELCSKAKGSPLHVAMKQINRPSYPTMYYALVYVKDEKDEKNICEGLNKLKVNDFELIVSPAEKLAEQGSVFLKSKG